MDEPLLSYTWYQYQLELAGELRGKGSTKAQIIPKLLVSYRKISWGWIWPDIYGKNVTKEILPHDNVRRRGTGDLNSTM